VEVCFALNLAQAAWKNYRNQYNEALDRQREASSDVTSDLLDTLANSNRVTKFIFWIYILIVRAVDYIQTLVVWSIYLLSVCAVFLCVWMLYFDRYSEWNFLLLFPPVFLPLLYFTARLSLALLGKLIQWLLKVPTGKDMIKELK
jgi:hypothetical protein